MANTVMWWERIWFFSLTKSQELLIIHLCFMISIRNGKICYILFRGYYEQRFNFFWQLRQDCGRAASSWGQGRGFCIDVDEDRASTNWKKIKKRKAMAPRDFKRGCVSIMTAWSRMEMNLDHNPLPKARFSLSLEPMKSYPRRHPGKTCRVWGNKKHPPQRGQVYRIPGGLYSSWIRNI